MVGTLDIGEMAAAVDGIKKAFLESAQRHCPVRTGATRASLSVRSSTKTDGMTFALYGSPVASYLIGGTRAHTIVPVNASVLHFESGGQDVFAMFVHHPGTKANDFRRPVLDEMRPAMQAAGSEALQAVIANIKRRFA